MAEQSMDLMTAFGMVGGTATAFVSIFVAWGKAKEIASKPLDELRSDLKALRSDVDVLKVHFDPKGGDVRGKLDNIDKRLASIEIGSANERAELKGLLTELRPIVVELRERM